MVFEVTLPDFLVIGAQRAGTTWLDNMLRTHQQIFLPSFRKEVHFFDDFYSKGIDWYERFFPDPEEATSYRAVGETTPRYLYDPQVPGRIAQVIPRCRLIAMLRDPVDRAYSQYSLSVKDEGESKTFEEALEANSELIQRGWYSHQLERFLARFEAHQLLVCIFEEAVEDPVVELGKIGAFLDVDPSGFDEDVERANYSYVPRFRRSYSVARRFGVELRRLGLDRTVEVAKKLRVDRAFGDRGQLPPMEQSTRDRLRATFRPEVKRVERLLGRPVPAWSRP